MIGGITVQSAKIRTHSAHLAGTASLPLSNRNVACKWPMACGLLPFVPSSLSPEGCLPYRAVHLHGPSGLPSGRPKAIAIVFSRSEQTGSAARLKVYLEDKGTEHWRRDFLGKWRAQSSKHPSPRDPLILEGGCAIPLLISEFFQLTFLEPLLYSRTGLGARNNLSKSDFLPWEPYGQQGRETDQGGTLIWVQGEDLGGARTCGDIRGKCHGKWPLSRDQQYE